MKEPVEPNKEDCCNSGCNPCIFDIYEKQLKLYRKFIENGEDCSSSQENGILQMEYTSFTVVRNTILCELHHLIQFKNTNIDNKKVWWNAGDHFLCKKVGPEVSCTRAYTPIKRGNNEDFSVIVKKYDGGVVSTYLCELKEGDLTLWRGPYGHYEMEPNKYSRIIMIGQGTGIAPFISIINNILQDEDNMSKLYLYYCCKTFDTILFRDELYDYKSYWNFKYQVFVSDCGTSRVKLKYEEPINKHRLANEDLCNLEPFSKSDQVLLCGSVEFCNTYNNYFRKKKI